MTPKERLAFLADKLEENANNPKGMKFDLSLWSHTERAVPKAIDCRTTGCAVGLAGLLPEFVAEGFSITGNIFSTTTPRYVTDRENVEGWRAVETFFDLSPEKAGWLFTEHRYQWDDLPTKGAAGELAVANRIREYLEKI